MHMNCRHMVLNPFEYAHISVVGGMLSNTLDWEGRGPVYPRTKCFNHYEIKKIIVKIFQRTYTRLISTENMQENFQKIGFLAIQAS